MSSLLYRWNATVAPTAFLLNNHRLHARCISLGSEQEQLAKKYIQNWPLFFKVPKRKFLLTFTMKKTWKHEKPKKIYYVVHTAPIIIGISSHKNNPIIFLVSAATVYVWLIVQIYHVNKSRIYSVEAAPAVTGSILMSQIMTRYRLFFGTVQLPNIILI